MQDLLKDSELVIDDTVFKFDDEELQKLIRAEPWKSSPTYFNKVKINALALMKMVSHSIKGSPIEIMGSMLGTVIGQSLVVLDVVPLPVEGTETRANAGLEAQEYANKYEQLNIHRGNNFGIIGWYHSHPGYGPFLSLIDINTQRQMQQQDPQVALVIDPVSTSITGKVDIGAFRSFKQEDETVGNHSSDFGDGIPEDKIKDFGMHHNKYYKIPIEYFVSSTDLPIVKDTCSRFWIRSLKDDELSNNQEYFVGKLNDFKQKSENMGKNLKNDGNKAANTTVQLKSLFKFSKEVSQSVHQECLRALSFR